MDWADTEGCAAARAIAMRVEPFGGFLDAERPGTSVALGIEPEDQPDEFCLDGIDIESSS